MRSEDRKTIREITKHHDLEKNLPAYLNAYMDEVYEYSLIHLVLNYYTLKEVEDDTAAVSSDEVLGAAMDVVHSTLFGTILSKELEVDIDQTVEKIHGLRDLLTKKMTVLTAYTDALQLYEYVLNRVEYGITKEEYPVAEDSLAARVFQYLFKDNDKMVINSKIQMVTSQLPVRMTKSRFFDYLAETLNIYIGCESSSVDDFVSMLKSTALLELPKGYGEDYKEIANLIHTLETVDYKTMDVEYYRALMEQFSMTTNHLTDLVSNYLIVMGIVNDLYAALLAFPYENNEQMGTKTCLEMLAGLHDAFVSGGEIPEVVDEGFMKIEGLQEELGEEIMQFEAILPDVTSEYKELMESIMMDKMCNSLVRISKLLSNSLFVKLDDTYDEGVMADADYIAKKRDEMEELLTAFFEKHTKELNRAVMALLFSNMPVLFNSQEEVKQYIEYSLNHCGNASELMACAKILDDMMAEE